MKFFIILILLFFIIGCDDTATGLNNGDNNVNSVILVKYDFNFNFEFSLDPEIKSNYKINEDTLVVYDYWGAVEQPSFAASILMSGDTIEINYNRLGNNAAQWEVSIETKLVIDISNYSGDPIIKFPTMAEARVPESDESYLRDAREEYVFQFLE